MTKNTTFTAPGYTSPSVKIIEIRSSRNILAASSENSISAWEEDDSNPLQF